MATIIDMPKLSDTMEEGVIAKWNIKEGDKVEPGDIVAEVETDKATMDLEAFDGGTVLKILVEEGVAVPLGTRLAILGEEGEDISGLLGDSDSKKPVAGEKAAAGKKAASGKEGSRPESDNDQDNQDDPSDAAGEVKASPLARKMAQERGIALEKVKGSGPQGRVIKTDIEQYEMQKTESRSADSKTDSKARDKADDKETEKQVSEAPVRKEDLSLPPASVTRLREDQEIRVSQMRKAIGRRLAESKFTSPHFYETIDIDMKRAIQARSSLNEVSEVKISFNDFVVKACAIALRRHPSINATWKGDVIQVHGEVHVAVAVAIDEGLITPVIRHTDQKGLQEISIETKQLATRARDRQLQPEEWEGSTFTISNLGMFGIEEFTAIINPPNASILAVGAIRDVPVVENGQVVPGKRMKVTLSSDHRIVDGAKAAEFLSTLRNLLENPVNMLL